MSSKETFMISNVRYVLWKFKLRPTKAKVETLERYAKKWSIK